MTASEVMCEHKCVHHGRTDVRTISEEKREVGEVFWIVNVLQVVCSGLS